MKSLARGLSVRFFDVMMPIVVDRPDRSMGKILSDSCRAPNRTTDLEYIPRKRPVASMAKCIGRDPEVTTARGTSNPFARKASAASIDTKWPGQGSNQGNRVKKSCGNETCEKVVVPGGDFAFGAEAWLAGSFSN